MMNKKGYVLVYALGIVTLLILLTVSLTNFTMQRTFFANNNVNKIKSINKAQTQIDAAASELSNYFNSYINHEHRYLYELNSNFELTFLDIESRYKVEIRDLTKESCEYPNDLSKPVCYPVKLESYTYAYEIVYTDGKLVAQKKFFLSMIPSFLYFALGSKSDITINGGAFVYGDMYVNNNLIVSDSTNYVLNNNLYKEQSSFLTVYHDNNIYLNNNLYSCRETSIISCYTLQNDSKTFIRNINNYSEISSTWEYNTTFTETPPTIKKYSDRFLNVDFDASYIYYLNDAIGEKNRSINLNDLTNELNTFVSENKLYKANTIEDIKNQESLSVLIEAPETTINKCLSIELIDGSETCMFNFNKDKWIIINGDLTINYLGYPKIFIDANFLVTGNITIAGNVQINSTIYALGKGLIQNAHINNEIDGETNNNELVLLTKDSLQFSKINIFENNFSSKIQTDISDNSLIFNPDIKGFFYTDRNAGIYTVGSYIAIEGGIFTNDSKNPNINNPSDYVINTDSAGLVINSYRGRVTEDLDTGEIVFNLSENYLQSRLIIKHNSSIIKDQPKGLPLNKEINYLFEDTIIK